VVGRLPVGWASTHVAGNNTVPWRTSNTFMSGGSNALFHANANDGLSGNHTRTERLVSPIFDVPEDSEYVALDFDLEYNTEDEPAMKVWAYDGVVLRIADFGPTDAAPAPAAIRSVLAEAYADEFRPGGAHYPSTCRATAIRRTRRPVRVGGTLVRRAARADEAAGDGGAACAAALQYAGLARHLRRRPARHEMRRRHRQPAGGERRVGTGRSDTDERHVVAESVRQR
jgi:hypothetical protein